MMAQLFGEITRLTYVDRRPQAIPISPDELVVGVRESRMSRKIIHVVDVPMLACASPPVDIGVRRWCCQTRGCQIVQTQVVFHRLSLSGCPGHGAFARTM